MRTLQCVNNVAYYRQFVSLEIYKIANTPVLEWFFSHYSIQSLCFLPEWQGGDVSRGDICILHPTAAGWLAFP